MQLPLIESGRQAAPRTATERTAVSRTTALARADESPRQATGLLVPFAAPVRGGLKGIDTRLNGQVAGAQQTLEYLDRVGTQLQSLRTAITSRPSERAAEAGGESGAAEIEQQIRRVGALLRQRSAATAGALDNQLAYDAPGRARQTFSIRGLQLATLRSGDAETLNFSLGGKAQSAASVSIEPGLPDAAIVQRFDRALAPAGVRAARDAQGELSFTVSEAAWPAVRDSLAIKGEGRRFPTGQFSQVRIAAQEPVLRPQEWSTSDPAAVRRTLLQVLTAQELVRNAQQGANRALAQAGSRLLQTAEAEATAQAEGSWAAGFAETFEATAARGDYQALAAITPALQGISRDRVTALLGLPAR